MNILLDMDGVLCNFIGAALAAHGQPPETEVTQWKLWDQLGMTVKQFWAEIDKQSFKFWAGLTPYPWASELFDLAKTVGDVRIISNPAIKIASISGKVAWLQKWFGMKFRNYVMVGVAEDKALLANPETLLIDDYDATCDAFREAGGKAILFPQPWNSAREHVSHRMQHIRDNLGYLIEARQTIN